MNKKTLIFGGIIAIILVSLVQISAQKAPTFQKATIESKAVEVLKVHFPNVKVSDVTYKATKTKLTHSTDESKIIVIELEVNDNGTIRKPSWIMSKKRAEDLGVVT